jgi:hypothetical protein
MPALKQKVDSRLAGAKGLVIQLGGDQVLPAVPRIIGIP